jgi:O-antigen/teichoic acid export membrane protein
MGEMKDDQTPQFDSFLNATTKVLPEWFLGRFRGDWNKEGFKKYFANTGWLLANRIISLTTSFLTVAIVARYLGPENLGKLEYSQSFVAIISIFAALGIDQILYRDLVAHPEKENELLGTAIYAKFLFGGLAFILATALSFVLNDDFVITLLISIGALTYLINPLGTVSILFNAQVKSKYWSQIVIFLAVLLPVLKLLIVYLDKGIIYFASILVAEASFYSAWLLFIYISKFSGNPRNWLFKWIIFKQLMRDSWPLLLAGFSGFIYARMDQVMLLHYLDASSVGIYSSAVKLTQVWAFIPALIIGSLFPAIVRARKIDLRLYKRRLYNLSGFTLLFAVVISIPIFFLAPFLISIVFGSAYISAVPILRIYLWTGVAITLVSLIQHYLLAENLTKVLLYTSLIGAITNIILNVILIPLFGASGAAWATMISYFSVTMSAVLVIKNTALIRKRES